MLRVIDENGTKMVAVVLGEKTLIDEETLERFRNALFEVLEAALLNESAFDGCWFSGDELYHYTRLMRALHWRTNESGNGKKKGGRA